MSGDYLGLDYKLIDEYFKLKEEIDRIEIKIKPLRDVIKRHMAENNLDKMEMGKYNIELKIKYVATQKFIDLLKEKNLRHYIVESCPIRLFRIACKDLNIGVGGMPAYLELHPSRWLYVKNTTRKRNNL